MNHQNEAVHRMAHDMRLNPEIGEALTTLGMMNTITQILLPKYSSIRLPEEMKGEQPLVNL